MPDGRQAMFLHEGRGLGLFAAVSWYPEERQHQDRCSTHMCRKNDSKEKRQRERAKLPHADTCTEHARMAAYGERTGDGGYM